MQNNYISLLYPSYEKYENGEYGKYKADISDQVLEDLGLSSIFDLKMSSLSDYFTVNEEVINYRQEVFKDIMANPDVTEVFNELLPILSDIEELRKISAETPVGEGYLYSITEIELYVSCIELLNTRYCSMADKLTSNALLSLLERIKELTESDYYIQLNKQLKELTSRVREIKSVTIGVNLNETLRPESAGVLSVNNEHFKSGELLQKILRLDFKNDEYTCIASLMPFKKGQSDNQQTALSYAFYNALNTVFKSSMRSWKNVVKTYVLENADFLLKIMPEIEYIQRGAELLKILKSGKNTICFPRIFPVSEKRFVAKGIYNPVVAYKSSDTMVTNDFQFDENGMIYVLTGPNRGGKSVITCAVGLTFALAQLGLCVPCEYAEISPVDAIFTHFPSGSEDTIDKGRLGEECARLDEIFDKVTGKCLVLLDESLSSTGSFEGAYIASEVLAGLSIAKCRCVFSTHLHELSSMIDEINKKSEKQNGSKIDTLVAGIEDGERSFKIKRAKPDGKSYAKDIAEKYGISYAHIVEKIKKNEEKN